jgi:hypothetical protein
MRLTPNSVTVCPPRRAQGAHSEYSARCNNPAQPVPSSLFPKAPDIRLHRIDIYWLTYTLLDPNRLNRLDVITPQKFLTLLENKHGRELY